ncbi:RNA-guided endonuclease IscB [Ammonifex thiophilus]
MPCHPARARQLLKKGRAAVFRRHPFTIILKDREGGETQPLELKIDPGAKVTGLPLVAEFPRGREVLWAAELHHRGEQVREALHRRRGYRRFRRYRKTRYREPRFSNRGRPEGWLPPSLESRVANILTWGKRLCRWSPVTAVSVELAKFDTQKFQHPEISGIEYQQGELSGYEVREYLLEKYGRRCAYCGKEDVPLEVDHVVPKSRGGTDRVSNLTLACRECNRAKGNRLLQEWLEDLKKSRRAVDRKRAENIPKVLSLLKEPLKGAAFINATRYALVERLKALGLPVFTATAAQTKYNRARQGYPKAHWIDAACVGETGESVRLDPGMQALKITARGHGSRRVQNVDRYGFPRGEPKRVRRFMGFATGDLVKAVIPTGKYAGVHVGRVAIRSRPGFRLNGFDVHPKHLRLLQRADGYEYDWVKGGSGVSSPRPEGRGPRRRVI